MQYEELIQPALWLVTIGVALAFLIRAFLQRRRPRGKPKARRSMLVVLGAVLVGVLLIPAIAFVPAGHRGVVYEWGGGVNPSERAEGITFLVPWVQHMRPQSVRTHKIFSDQVFSQSSDLQEITVVTSLNYHVDPTKAAELYQNVGPNFESTVIQPALFQRTKAAVGQVKAEDFALQRSNLAQTIENQLTVQLAGFGIEVEFVNIEDAVFDPSFLEAVKAKIIAEQEALRQENLIAAAANVKEQVIIEAEANAKKIEVEAEAQAEANRKIAASLTSEMLRWQWIIDWDGTLPTTLLEGDDVPLILDGRE